MDNLANSKKIKWAIPLLQKVVVDINKVSFACGDGSADLASCVNGTSTTACGIGTSGGPCSNGGSAAACTAGTGK